MRFLKDRKGALGGVAATVVTLGIIAIMIAVVSLVVTNMADDIADDVGAAATNTSRAWNSSQDALEGVGNISEQLPLMGLIVAFGVVIAIVLAYFAFRGKRGGGL